MPIASIAGCPIDGVHDGAYVDRADPKFPARGASLVGAPPEPKITLPTEVMDLPKGSRMRVPSDTFTVHVKRSPGTARLRLTGRFDAAAVATLDAMIGVVQDRDVTIDLGGVTSMDGAGWRGVLAYQRGVHGWGKDVRLENAPEHVRRIFELTATEHLLADAVGM